MMRLIASFRQEPALLILVMLCAGGIWAFAELADAVGDGESHSVDEWLILALRNPADKADPLGPPWIEEIMRDYTALGGFAILTPLTFSTAVYLWLRKRGRVALVVLIAVGGGIILSTIMKSYFDRPRPDLVPHGSYVLSKSFPSGHAMMAATTYLTLGAIMAETERKRALRVFFLAIGVLLAILVGVSRVYLGVHWPSDVLAGWVAGSLWALCCWMTARALDTKRHAVTHSANPAASNWEG